MNQNNHDADDDGMLPRAELLTERFPTSSEMMGAVLRHEGVAWVDDFARELIGLRGELRRASDDEMEKNGEPKALRKIREIAQTDEEEAMRMATAIMLDMVTEGTTMVLSLMGEHLYRAGVPPERVLSALLVGAFRVLARQSSHGENAAMQVARLSARAAYEIERGRE